MNRDLPASAWTSASESGGESATGPGSPNSPGDLLAGWPTGMRLIVRRERPHSGAQLRSPTPTACGSTASPPTPASPSIAELELRHRLRARAADRATGLRSLQLHDTAQNKVWLEPARPRPAGLDPSSPRPAKPGSGNSSSARLFFPATQLVTTARRPSSASRPTARTLPRLTSSSSAHAKSAPIGAVETGSHPRRHSGRDLPPSFTESETARSTSSHGEVRSGCLSSCHTRGGRVLKNPLLALQLLAEPGQCPVQRALHGAYR